jgi:hypothetical protein
MFFNGRSGSSLRGSEDRPGRSTAPVKGFSFRLELDVRDSDQYLGVMRRYRISGNVRWLVVTALVTVCLGVASNSSASIGAANARQATRSERQALAAVFGREDGNPSEIRGVYVSRSDANLAVVCARTPEAGTYAYVFTHSHRHWRYATSGRPGRAGSSRQRQLERACT